MKFKLLEQNFKKIYEIIRIDKKIHSVKIY